MYKLTMLSLLGLLTAGSAMAQTTAPTASPVNVETRQQKMEARLDKLAARLGLDAQGKAALESTFARYREQMQPVRQDVRQTRQALRAELRGAKDAKRLASLTAQLSSDRQKLQSLRAAKMSALQQQLTPAQYAQLVVSRHKGRHFSHQRRSGQQ
jgi:Skp family chaperone for outer membrane proteins